MPPKPTVDPDLIRDVICTDPRPTATEAAQILTELVGRPISPLLVQAAISRYRNRPDWHLGPPQGPPGGSSSSMDYVHERDLAPFPEGHPALRRQLACWERIHVRPDREPRSLFESRVMVWGQNLLRGGRVVDVMGDMWVTRPGWPWELGCLWRQPQPPDDQMRRELTMITGETTVTVTGRHGHVEVHLSDEHARLWREALDTFSRV